jgi:hypothetical protein
MKKRFKVVGNIIGVAAVMLVFFIIPNRRLIGHSYYLWENEITPKRCKMKGFQTIKNDKYFAVCESWTTDGGRYKQAYILDTSGQLARSPKDMTMEFKIALQSKRGNNPLSGLFRTYNFTAFRLYDDIHIVYFHYVTSQRSKISLNYGDTCNNL